MPRYESLPYRPCVGIMVLNRDGLVFIGRRIDGPEHVDATHDWQMPQGGIDEGEDPWPAALRELYEETNIRSVEKLGEIEEWLTYDIPREIVGAGMEAANIAARRRNGTRCASPATTARSTSPHPAGGHKPEFIAWRWEPMQKLPTLIMPFKRPVYERVVKEFAKFA